METENKTNLKEPELLEYHGADSIANLEPPDKEPPSNNRENKLFLAFNITVAIIGVILLYSAWGNHRLGAAVILALIPANIARRKGYSYNYTKKQTFQSKITAKVQSIRSLLLNLFKNLLLFHLERGILYITDFIL